MTWCHSDCADYCHISSCNREKCLEKCREIEDSLFKMFGTQWEIVQIFENYLIATNLITDVHSIFFWKVNNTEILIV